MPPDSAPPRLCPGHSGSRGSPPRLPRERPSHPGLELRDPHISEGAHPPLSFSSRSRSVSLSLIDRKSAFRAPSGTSRIRVPVTPRLMRRSQISSSSKLRVSPRATHRRRLEFPGPDIAGAFFPHTCLFSAGCSLGCCCGRSLSSLIWWLRRPLPWCRSESLVSLSVPRPLRSL